jgi:dienelactone hydrolase
MKDFQLTDFAHEALTLPVYMIGIGPAVVLMQELPGINPTCVDLAREIASRGFRVYLPLLVGQPDRSHDRNLKVASLKNLVRMCIRREFDLFASRQSSPITNWLRALCRQAHAECGGRGVGAIGMCMTAGFVLSLVADRSTIAPVMTQISYPIAADKLDLSAEELMQVKDRVTQGVPILALRFSGDSLSSAQRFATLEREFGSATEIIQDDNELCWRQGNNLELIEINSQPGNPFGISTESHSVLTDDLRGVGHPTYRVKQRVLEFLQEQLQQ